jgi:hypothetical protein
MRPRRDLALRRYMNSGPEVAVSELRHLRQATPIPVGWPFLSLAPSGERKTPICPFWTDFGRESQLPQGAILVGLYPGM